MESFLGAENLYFTSSTTPGKVWLWQEDSWSTGTPTAAPSRWVTPWNDLGSKQIVKGGFEVYLLCEVKDDPVTLKISIQTEKKTKTKLYMVNPVTDDTRQHKQKRIHFGGSGRRFRMIIETEANTPSWRLVSGVLIISEIDAD